MKIEEYLPFWQQLEAHQKALLQEKTKLYDAKKGTIVHNGGEDCLGLIVVVSGQLRSYTMSEEGKEVTLYRLLERDACLFAASCIMNNIAFEVIIEALADSQYFVIPSMLLKDLMETSLVVSNYANQLMAARFTDVMWVMDQILNKSVDVRLAAFLVEEAGINGERILPLTHEAIAHHLGSAREVVTRMLKYFQAEELVSLSRGSIEIKNMDRLYALAGDSVR